MSRFNKKTAQKFVVVHRPHDDPNFYDNDASEHILVPVEMPNRGGNNALPKSSSSVRFVRKSNEFNEHIGEASLYGIKFDDTSYDYTKHLKPIGLDPENSIYISSKSKVDKVKVNKQNIEELFVEPEYQDGKRKEAEAVFFRGMAKPEYLEKMQDIPDELRGFQPDMNPALREVLEALEDDAYVVNSDVIVGDGRKLPKDGAVGDDDANNKKSGSVEAGQEEEDEDLFAELLGSGEVKDKERFQDDFDEWDIDNFEGYEEQCFQDEIAQFDNIENLRDLQAIDIGADVRRFKKVQSKQQNANEWDSDDNFSEAPDEAEEENDDILGDMPVINKTKISGSKKRKDRRKKGAMSDVSGYSMSSSAIARTEVMTILDDKYDQIISGYENYEEEQENNDENYVPFDMARERADFEELLDDFLDNYELEKGGRKLAKKDKEIDNLKIAADEVSKGKLSMRRKKERSKNGVDGVTNCLQSLRF
ncbi:ribosome biogenesis protein LTV1 Ecym_8252 [Eremothecium cymbalariae DBVPG|uniref:Protein LTV1 n=1 Tax=Eremothecium cymbalariae (strain CBS 270.75 / DBVPG 7215 / KCTC 17166 / NRRL Y-17582) TaxID=931890 RepID=G8JXG1_ERECY|nr:Hypothetical protein Ecym_8252 [Eremothecium cymbalariae DBVPG\